MDARLAQPIYRMIVYRVLHIGVVSENFVAIVKSFHSPLPGAGQLVWSSPLVLYIYPSEFMTLMQADNQGLYLSSTMCMHCVSL